MPGKLTGEQVSHAAEAADNNMPSNGTQTSHPNLLAEKVPKSLDGSKSCLKRDAKAGQFKFKRDRRFEITRMHRDELERQVNFVL